MTYIQKFALVFAVLAAFAVALGYVPGLSPGGQLLGLFAIDPIDDIIHGLTAVGAFVAGIHSPRWSTWFFRAFAMLYGLDAVVGMVTGRGLLDLSVFRVPGAGLDVGLTNWLINLPHITLAGTALVLGFFLYRRLGDI